MSVYRIQRLSGGDAGERPKGYSAGYRFLKDDVPIYQCYSNRWCTKPSEFKALDKVASTGFTLKSTRQVLPMTWQIKDMESDRTYGFLKRKLLGKTDWHIQNDHSKNIGRFQGRYNPRFWLFRMGDIFFGGRLPDGYEIFSDRTIVARMEREKRPENPSNEKKSGLRKLISKVFTESDWVIREENGREGRIDHRLLLAGAILLVSINRDVSM